MAPKAMNVDRCLATVSDSDSRNMTANSSWPWMRPTPTGCDFRSRIFFSTLLFVILADGVQTETWERNVTS